MNFILPLMKLTPDGSEAEEEIHLSQTKRRNLPDDGAAKVLIHPGTLHKSFYGSRMHIVRNPPSQLNLFIYP